MLPSNELINEAVSKSPGLLSKLYDDLLHPPAKEIGVLLRDIAKTVCILGYPFMLGAAYKDRISEKVYKIAESVSENLRVMPYPQIFLEYLDKTKYIPDKSLIIDSYDKLLASALNKDKRDFIHPAFIMILAQLSSDEILIINKLKKQEFKLKRKYYPFAETKDIRKKEIIENEFPLEILHNKDLYSMYCNHLEMLNLLRFSLDSSETEKNSLGEQIAVITISKPVLTEFGSFFVQICCVED